MSALTIAAQEPSYTHFTVHDGLVSRVVYHAFQDSKGFIWFGTDGGVSRYDGYQFHNYTLNDGLSDNEVFEIFEDSQERIWFLTFNGKPSYFLKGQIFNEKNDIYLKKIDTKSFMTCIYEDNNKNIWIGSDGGSIYKIANNGEVVIYNKSKRVLDGFVSIIDQNTEGDIVFITSSEIAHISNDSIIIDTFYSDHKNVKLRSVKEDNNQTIHFYAYDEFYIYDLRLKKLHREKLSISPKTEVVFEGLDHKQNLWIGTRNGVFLNVKGTSNHRYFLKGKTVTSVLQDNEGNYWFTTLKDGIFFSSSLEVKNFTKQNGLPQNAVHCLAQDDDGNIWMGFDEGMYSRFSLKGIKTGQLKYNIHRARINDIYTFKGIWLASDNAIAYLRDQKIAYYSPMLSRSIILSEDETFYAGGTTGTYYVSKDKRSENSYEDYLKKGPKQELIETTRITEERTYKLYLDEQKRLWIGMTNGIYIFNTVTQEMDTLSNMNYPELNSRITDITGNRKGIVWVSTQGHGIFAIKEKKIIHHITRQDGLASNICKSIYVDEKENLWIATNKGVNKIIIDNYSVKTFKIECFDTKAGILSDDVNDILVNGDSVWVATSLGLSFFKQSEITSKKTSPLVYITHILNRQNDLLIKDHYEFSYNNNDLKINFLGISYKSRGEINYKYRLAERDENWTTTSSTNVEYLALAPDHYKFEVVSINSDGVESKAPASFSFIIHPPFWKTWWFALLSFVSFLMMIYWFFKVRVLTYNRDVVRELLKFTLDKLKGKQHLHIKITDGSYVQMLLQDILWIQAAKDYVEIVTAGKKFLVYSSMKSVLQKLPEKHFSRIHRSYIVNTKNIDKIRANSVFINEHELPIGRTYLRGLKELRQQFNGS